MKRAIIFVHSLAIIMLIGVLNLAISQEQLATAEENFYNKSLHYTNKGIEYLYAKEQGGIERITGVSASELGCLQSKCHIRTCDACHKKEVDGKAAYSLEPARAQEVCQKCHPVAKDDPDVHFRAGMKCMDCHTAREIHGDGIAHNTYMEPGFFDANCKNCHSNISKTASHTVHQGKLDCVPCHVKQIITCYNCHIDTRIKDKKDVQVELQNMFFLANHDGKVKLANFLSYVSQNKTMITFAPYFPHSIQKEGRTCQDCHGTQIVKDIEKKKFLPFKWENGQIKNVAGMIPVVEGMKWNLVYLTHENGKWTPLQNPDEPLLNYSGFCSPLTNDQFKKLTSLQKVK